MATKSVARRDVGASLLDRFSDETLERLSALTEKRRAFVLAYSLPDSETYADARASAKEAGLPSAPELLANELVRFAILSVEKDCARALEPYAVVDAAWIHHRLSVWANSSILDFGTVDPETGHFRIDLRRVADRPELAQLIDSVEETVKPNGDRVFKLRKISHRQIIELLGKHAAVGAWREVVEHRDGDRADKIKRARERQRKVRDVTKQAKRTR